MINFTSIEEKTA